MQKKLNDLATCHTISQDAAGVLAGCAVVTTNPRFKVAPARVGPCQGGTGVEARGPTPPRGEGVISTIRITRAPTVGVGSYRAWVQMTYRALHVGGWTVKRQDEAGNKSGNGAQRKRET